MVRRLHTQSCFKSLIQVSNCDAGHSASKSTINAFIIIIDCKKASRKLRDHVHGLCGTPLTLAKMPPDMKRAPTTSLALLLLLATSPALADPPADSDFTNKLTGDWAGQRAKLEQSGVSINGALVLEGFKNLQGGIDDSHLAGDSTFDLNVALDTDKLFHLPGGKFYVDLEDHAGQDPSAKLVGDLQRFDQENSAPYLQIAEVYYDQKLLDDKLRLKVGKVDANSEFSVIDNGLPFFGSSSQVTPTIFVMPTTPDPMPSINAFLTPVDWFSASFGAYYSNQSDRFGDIVDNPTIGNQFSQYGAFLIGETGLTWKQTPLLPHEGNFKVGAWAHTGAFTRFDGTTQDGTSGYYAILDQTLWQPPSTPDDGPGIRTFLQYGQSERSVSPLWQHFGGGLSWTGLIPNRAQDILGFSPQYTRISGEQSLPHTYELSLESFYQIQLTPWATLQPDAQYIVNPGGRYSDALVVSLRLAIQF